VNELQRSEAAMDYAEQYREGLEGELLWDPAAGHAYALLLEGEQGIVQTSSQSFEGNRHHLEMTTTFEFEGSREVDYSFE